MNFLENLEEVIQKTIEKNSEIKKDINNIKNDQGARPLSQEEINLASKLDAVEEFTIDRFEGDIALLEDRENGKMLNVDKDVLPKDIKEGDILKKINGKYFLDKNSTKEVGERIKKKMDDLWN